MPHIVAAATAQGGLGGKSKSKQDDAWTESYGMQREAPQQECGLVNKTHMNIKRVTFC